MDIEKIIGELTVEEKAALCSGRDSWHLARMEHLDIPAIMVTDGPHGLRKEVGEGDAVLKDSVPATCFPTASCLASTWNRDLVSRVGQAIAEEALEERVSVVLGPGANIKRSPLCGRNFEYFSEDPCLSGEMAKNWIAGLQRMGVGASLKHYAVNNQEYRRMTIDAVVDERALREIYLAGFERAVRAAQPWAVMAAYNRVNGTYCCENQFLLEDVLREEWAFQSLVMSDWGAMNERAAGLAAGCDLEMPGPSVGNRRDLVHALRAGELDERVLDQSVWRVLHLIEQSLKNLRADFHYDRAAHHGLAREAAAEGAVLLKNERALLPFDQTGTIALVGAFARYPRYQGSGSSLIHPTRLDNLYDEMLRLAGPEQIRYAPGYDLDSRVTSEDLIEEATAIAKEADYALVCAGLTDRYEVEGVDRESLALPPSHHALIRSIAAANPRTVVVLSNGAPLEMPWLPEVGAVLEAYLGGQAGAGAVADILYGHINPSGKLAETFPIQLADNPSFAYFPGGPAQVEYRESIFVGYRFYDTVEKRVLFPFGHGLSYTSFAYSDLQCNIRSLEAGQDLMISLQITNTGNCKGKEIVQVYVRDVQSSIPRPEKELKNFAKIELAAGASAVLSLKLEWRDFACYDVGAGEWVVEAGQFDILVGASSRDIRLQERITVCSDQKVSPEYAQRIPDAYREFPGDAGVSREAFQQLLGYPLPPNEAPRRGEYTLNTPIDQMGGSLFGRILGRKMKKQINKLVARRAETPSAMMVKKFVEEAPLRSILREVNGKFTRPMLDAILLMANGKIIRGALALRRERRKKIARENET